MSVTLEERRGSLTLVSHHHLDHHHCHHDDDDQVLGLKEGRLVMRRTEGIREWQRGLQRLSGHYPQCAHYKLTIGCGGVGDNGDDDISNDDDQGTLFDLTLV